MPIVILASIENNYSFRRIAAEYFESMLIDFDVHSNYGNWMYNSGVGNDPRDRMLDIKRQSEMYDSKGKYQALWLNPDLH